MDAELATPLEQRPNQMTDRPLAYFKTLVISIERALSNGETENAQRQIKLLSYSATDGLDYETELATAVAAYLEVVDPT